MSEFGREGRTVVFVSHDLGSITQVCRRAVWLDGGRVQADGPSEEIVQRYVRGAVGALAQPTSSPTRRSASRFSTPRSRTTTGHRCTRPSAAVR